jgi:hypothetical protein
MPSDSRTLAWLRSQGLGLICGQATVLLLAVGSVVVASTRDGATRNLHLDDIRFFFDEPAVVHGWFYALLVVMVLYGVNTALATWHSVASKLRARQFSPWLYGTTLIHIAFLLGLVAHLVGGLGSAERGTLVVGDEWQTLQDGTLVRLTGTEVRPHPDGSPRRVRARLEFLDPAGRRAQHSLGYNEPISRGFGTDLMLLARMVERPSGVRLSDGQGECRLQVGGGCELGGGVVLLRGFRQAGPRPDLRMPLVSIAAPGGSLDDPILMIPWHPQTLPSGSLLQLLDIERSPAVQLRRRRAPGNPIALLASVFLLAGLVLMGRRWIR